jgi:hypothetical protein
MLINIWFSWKPAQGRQYFSKEAERSCIKACSVKPYDIFIENQQMQQNDRFIAMISQSLLHFSRTNSIIRELIWSSQANYMSVWIAGRLMEYRVK